MCCNENPYPCNSKPVLPIGLEPNTLNFHVNEQSEKSDQGSVQYNVKGTQVYQLSQYACEPENEHI